MSTNRSVIKLGGISLDVVHKNIKNVHLSVHPPMGRVTISAPLQMALDTIRLFSISKLGWIRKQQHKLKNQSREASRDYVNRESHYYLGQRYLLKIVEVSTAQRVILKHDTIELHMKAGSSRKQREALIQAWYRQQLKEIAMPYVSKLEKRIGVAVGEVSVRSMKTKWGTCNIAKKRVWLNTELAKKSVESVEYVLVHEMVHLLERNHNERFIAHMNKFLPKWRHLRGELNRSPLGHIEWAHYGKI